MHHYYYKCAKFHFNNSYPLLNYVQKWQFVVHASQQTTSVSKLSLTDIPIVHVLQRKQQLQSPINNLHLWEFLSWLCIFDNFIVKISTLQHNTFDSNNIQPGTLRLLAAAVWIETCTSSSPSRFNGLLPGENGNLLSFLTLFVLDQNLRYKRHWFLLARCCSCHPSNSANASKHLGKSKHKP